MSHFLIHENQPSMSKTDVLESVMEKLEVT